MRGRHVVAWALALWAGIAPGGTNTWTPMGPAGGAVADIVYGGTPGTVFARSRNSVYRSQDSGSTWVVVKDDFVGTTPQALAVDPSDASRVYLTAVGTPSLYVSQDGGASFTALSTAPTGMPVTHMAVSEDGRTLYVAGQGRMLRSGDRGLTWSEATPFSTVPGSHFAALQLEPGDPDTLYAAGRIDATQSVIKRSRDGGRTWTTVQAGAAASQSTFGLAVSRANPAVVWAARQDGILRSTDRGATWTSFRSGEAFAAIHADPQDASVAIAGSPFGPLLRTVDAGTTWQEIGTGQRAGQIFTVVSDPANGARILVGGGAGIWGSLNAGAAWSPRNNGLLNAMVDEISADPSTGRLYFNAEPDGLYQVTGAAPPQPLDNVELGGLQPGPQYVLSMLVQPGRILASLTAGLARSTDGGNSWSLQRLAPLGTSQQLFDIQSSTAQPQIILAAGTRGMYRSTDGGLSWSTAGAGIPADADLERLRVAPSDGRIAYVSAYRIDPATGRAGMLGIYRSADGGLNWSPASAGAADLALRLLAIDPTTPDTIYAANETQLRRSLDGGTTWSTLGWNPRPASPFPPLVLAVDARNGDVLYAANHSLVARSVDAGASWQTLATRGTAPFVQQLLVDPFRAATVLLSTSDQGVQHFAVSPDLVLTGTPPAGPSGIGLALAHAFTLRNQGPFDATSVALSLRWPATAQGLTLVSSAGNCVTSVNTAICRVPILRAGASLNVSVTASATTAGSFEVEAGATAAEPDVASGDNAIAMITTIVARAELSVSMTGSTSVSSGSAARYTLTVRNDGPDTAASPTLAIQLATGLVASSVTASTGTCTTSSAIQISCALGNLPTGASTTIDVTAATGTTGDYLSTARLATTTFDATTADNGATWTTTVTSSAPAAPPAASGGGGAISLGQLLALTLLSGLLHLRRRFGVPT